MMEQLAERRLVREINSAQDGNGLDGDLPNQSGLPPPAAVYEEEYENDDGNRNAKEDDEYEEDDEEEEDDVSSLVPDFHGNGTCDIWAS